MINSPINRIKLRNNRYTFVLLIALLFVLAYLISSASIGSTFATGGQEFFKNSPFGTITIVKQTLPDGDPTNFRFVGDRSATLADGQSATYYSIAAPAMYNVTEIMPRGWSLINISCDDNDSIGNVATRTATFNVAASEWVTCIFTNKKWDQTFSNYLPRVSK